MYLCGLLLPKEELVVDILLTFHDESPDNPVVVLSPRDIQDLGLSAFGHIRLRVQLFYSSWKSKDCGVHTGLTQVKGGKKNMILHSLVTSGNEKMII